MNSAMANVPCVPTSPDWVLLDRTGRTIYYVAGDPVHKALKNKEGTVAVEVRTSSRLSGYFSFTLATPPDNSYLNLHWPKSPKESPWFPTNPAYSSVLAADKNLLLLRIAVPSLLSHGDAAPHDLFVYTASAPRPSLEHLQLYTKSPQKGFGKFFVRISDIGILRLAGDQGHYVVADLIVAKPRGSSNHVAEACVLFSAAKTRINWKLFSMTALQPSDGGQFPVRWITSTVLPFDGHSLCWIDYFSGVLLLSNFSQTNDPALRFLPFPGKQYPDKVRMATGRCSPDRFRSVSIIQGIMHFVHIDNDFHERMHMPVYDAQPPQESGTQNITIWTLNLGEFKWEKHREICLDNLWASYQDQAIPQCLPEFPVITMDGPDRVWCILRDKEFRGRVFKIVVDMKNAKLESCTPYVNDQPYLGESMDLKNTFACVPPLPAVFSKYLNNATGC